MKNFFSFLIFFVIIFFTFNNLVSAPRNVLLEFCTGTWCQACPCGDATAENIHSAYPNTVIIAYHGMNNDPFDFFFGWEIRVLLGYTSYPTAIIDRTNTPTGVTYNYWMSRVSTRYASSPNADVDIVITNKYYNPATRQFTATINATPTSSLNGLYMVNFVFTENNVIYPQTGNSSCPGGTNFNHKWIARSMMNDYLGDTIHNGVWNTNQTISKSITKAVDTGWVAANCEFSVFVYENNDTLSLCRIMQALRTSVTGPLGVSNMNSVPAKFELNQNYPNPFNPKTNIKFSLPYGEITSLKIYDIKGNLVQTYFDGFLNAGLYNVDFNGSNLSSGIYFYKLISGRYSETKKMILIK